MEMNQIRYFLSVCQHRNFTHAAQAVHVSQPSLTASIKKLEEELGGALFLRNRAGCQLTPLGMLVRPYLETIQKASHDAKAEAARHIRLDRVPIKIGLGETIGHNKISAAIERYRLAQPEADIELIVACHSDLLEGLKEGLLDIAITSTEASNDLYRIDSLYAETYRVVVASTHPLSQYDGIALSRLAETSLLDRPNCEMRDALKKTCADRGYSLYAAYRSNRVDWLIQLARQGSGAVILPETAIPKEPGLVDLPIEDVDIQRQVYALRHRHQPSHSAVNNLLREFISA